jgi:hypothetical protein
MTPAWWTEADDAELDVLIGEVIDGYFDHRERCDEHPCSHLNAALEAIIDWRRGRELLSRAAYLRAKRDVIEARRAA